MSVRTALVLALCSVFGAHGLVYLLVGVLPDAAAISLGLESARPELMAAFHSTHSMRPYYVVLADLASLDLGKSLDGISVRRELAGSILASLPRLLAGSGLIALVCVATAFFVRGSIGKPDRLASLIAFLPPYLMPFLGMLLLLSLRPVLGAEISEASAPVLAVLAIAATPAALIAAQTANISRRNLRSDFARTLAAAGPDRCMSASDCCTTSRRNWRPVWKRCSPGWWQRSCSPSRSWVSAASEPRPCGRCAGPTQIFCWESR